MLWIRDLTAVDLADIATWSYDGPWSVYDSEGELDPSLGYWAVVDASDGRLWGSACLGADARVPGLGFVRTGTHPVGPVTYAVLERPVRPG